MGIILDRPALMVIDMQRYFIERGARAYLAPPASLLPNILTLIETFRTRGLTVVFTRHAHPKTDAAGQMGRWWDGKLPRLGDPESELVREISPDKGEILITKRHYSAFEGTDLAKRLKQKHIATLVFCGVMTNLCVETTARHAFMKDFQPVIVKDACAANNARLHKASLANLAYGFAHVVGTRTLVSKLKGAI